MRLTNDDELYHVDAVFLGPSGYTLPWRARYVAYGTGLLLCVVLGLFERRIGIALSFFSVAYTLLAVVLATRAIGRVISYETPLRSTLAVFWHELTAPRPSRAVRRAALRPGKVRGTWKDKVIIRGDS